MLPQTRLALPPTASQSLHTCGHCTTTCTYSPTSCYSICSTASAADKQAVCLSVCLSATHQSSCCSHCSVVFKCVPSLLLFSIVPVPWASRGGAGRLPATAPWPCDKRDPLFDLSRRRSTLVRVRHTLVGVATLPASLVRYIPDCFLLLALRGEGIWPRLSPVPR